MSYTLLAVLGVVGAVAADLLLLRTALVGRRLFWASYGVVLVFQLIANGILTGRAVVIYNPATIMGLRVVFAPVEDLLFGFTMVLLTLSTWVWLGRRMS